jgi:hypothetical protein
MPHADGWAGFRATTAFAFPAEPIQGDAAFAEWGGSYPDAVAYKHAIDGKTWEELDARYIVVRDDALGFLSIRELVQVLPVYLRAVVDDVWSPAVYAVLLMLTRPTTEPSRGRFEAFVQVLTPPQRKVIAATLRYIADQDPSGSVGRSAREALDSAWKEEP